MANSEIFYGSNVKLAGYLKLIDNPIYLGLSDNAFITTTLSSNSLDVINLAGDININGDVVRVYSNTQTILESISGGLISSIDLTPGSNASMSYIDAAGTSVLTTSLSGIILYTTPTAGTTNYLRIRTSNASIANNGSNNRFIIQDDANLKGFVNHADYSANFTPESLVTKRWVDNEIAMIGVSYWDLESSGELVLNLGVPGPVMPHTTGIVDLGSSSYKWQDLYLSGSIDKVTVNNAYTLPNVDGTNGQVLKTNGAGVVTWQTVIGGTGNLADLNDVTFTTGTPVIGDILVFNGTDWEARELPVTFNVSGAINSKKATNQYVESDDTGMFLSPFILPENAILKYMSASCAVADTWTAEVHVNGTLFTGATVTVTAAKKAYIKFTTSLSFSAGDEIQLYLNGTNIDKPRINATFVSVP